MCREASGDGLALPLLLISLANWDLCLAFLSWWQEKLCQRTLWVTHCSSMDYDARAWEVDGPTTPADHTAPGVWTAGHELPESCWGITDNEVRLCKPWQSGSCWASSSGGCAGPGRDSWHQQPSSCSCSCPRVTAFANLLHVLKLTSQHKAGLGLSICFAHLPPFYNPFLSFKLLQIIYEQ